MTDETIPANFAHDPVLAEIYKAIINPDRSKEFLTGITVTFKDSNSPSSSDEANRTLSWTKKRFS